MKNVASFGKLIDLPDVGISEWGLSNPASYLGGKEIDVICEDKRPLKTI